MFQQFLTTFNLYQVIGVTSGVTVFCVQFVALHIDSKLRPEVRALYRVFIGDLLAAIALISTVSNLRGIWMMLITLMPVGELYLV